MAKEIISHIEAAGRLSLKEPAVSLDSFTSGLLIKDQIQLNTTKVQTLYEGQEAQHFRRVSFTLCWPGWIFCCRCCLSAIIFVYVWFYHKTELCSAHTIDQALAQEGTDIIRIESYLTVNKRHSHTWGKRHPASRNRTSGICLRH